MTRLALPLLSILAVASLSGCEGMVGAPAGDGGADAACTVGCPIWSVRCGDECVDLTQNPQHCGACFAPCDAHSETCFGGVCMSAAGTCAPLPPLADPTDGGSPPVDAGSEFPPNEGLRGEYYGTEDLTTLLLVRTDPEVDFDWSNNPPAPGLPSANYSVRWTGKITPRFSETYTFLTDSDDGVRLWIDGLPLIDDWTSHGLLTDMGTTALTAGKAVAVRLEYLQVTGSAVVRFSWQSAHEMKAIVPASQLVPAPSTGVDLTCSGGACCAIPGGAAACCPTGTACVANARFTGCCPTGEKCGESACASP